jgi:hypothetical protein
MLVYRSTVAAAAISIGALLVACEAPDQPTDLRKEGPPNVTSVTVMSDLSAARIVETATFCRLNDEKRPGLVGLPNFTTEQVCPDDLSEPAEQEGTAEGAPPLWFVRVVFDMLLDPTIEDLIPVDPSNPNSPLRGTLRDTQPVTLRCNNVDVPYDGYYLPNGNRVSWPLGPDLFIQPVLATSVPTGATCEVAVKDMVVNKAGQAIPAGEKKTFTFKIGPMLLRSTTPAATAAGLNNGGFEQDFETPLAFNFTAPIAVPVNTTGFQIFEGANGAGDTPNAAVCTGAGAGVTEVPAASFRAIQQGTVAATTALVLQLGVNTGDMDQFWKPSTTYLVRFAAGAKVAAAQGSTPGTPDGAIPSTLSFCFHTPAAM